MARSLGILDEVNKMKVLPGASPVSSGNNKNVRYMGVSKQPERICVKLCVCENKGQTGVNNEKSSALK